MFSGPVFLPILTLVSLVIVLASLNKLIDSKVLSIKQCTPGQYRQLLKRIWLTRSLSEAVLIFAAFLQVLLVFYFW